MKTVVILLCFAFFSCASSDFRKKDLLGISQRVNVEIKNQPMDTIGGNFLELFGISHSATNVRLSFDESGDFRIVYNDPDFKKPQQKVFEGKFKRKYFEIYFEKKRVVFPPIYWVVNVHRFRLGVAKDSTLITENFYDRSGMILMMTAGSSHKSYSRFAINQTLK